MVAVVVVVLPLVVTEVVWWRIGVILILWWWRQFDAIKGRGHDDCEVAGEKFLENPFFESA